ncbi:MAG: homoserine dehydrogenase [Candidatus Sumerlaeia bacterium]|nr:homoserine dehydrogenase [Candidatus Sumerlaeia bacterium]
MSKPLKIALVGFGNIGTGLVRHLAEYGDLIARRLPRPIVLKVICDVDLQRDRGVSTAGITLTSDFQTILADPEIEAVVELVGGTRIAHTIVTGALQAGKHVVTANKALIATYGGELFAAARARGVQLLFEASVGAGIPIMRSLQTGLQSDRVRSLHGILNGTCNFILSAMEDTPGLAFQTVLEEAMRLGYAEPDPTLDIEGDDTAHKIAILGSLAFGRDLRIGNVAKMGITRLSPADFAFARKNGQTIKLLASAALGEDGTPALAVWPTLIPLNHAVGRVRGVTNTVWIEAEPIGPIMLTGAGAGQGSTSSGVLSDLCLIAQAGSGEALARLNPLTIPSGGQEPVVAPTHPRRVLRVATDRSAAVRAALPGCPVLAEEAGSLVLVAPHQSEAQRLDLYAKLAGCGVGNESVCELRVGLQASEGVLGGAGGTA